MQGKRDIPHEGRVNQPTEQASVEAFPIARALASSPCGLDHIATAPWEYGPEFLAIMDGSFSPARSEEGPSQACDVQNECAHHGKI